MGVMVAWLRSCCLAELAVSSPARLEACSAARCGQPEDYCQASPMQSVSRIFDSARGQAYDCAPIAAGSVAASLPKGSKDVDS